MSVISCDIFTLFQGNEPVVEETTDKLSSAGTKLNPSSHSTDLVFEHYRPVPRDQVPLVPEGGDFVGVR